MRSVRQIIKILEIESEASGATVKDIKQRIKKWSYTIEIKQ